MKKSAGALGVLIGALLLAGCNDTSSKPIVEPMPDPVPYDATGNWNVTFTSVDERGTHSIPFPVSLPVTMTDRSKGDFQSIYPTAGGNVVAMTGNTKAGTVRFAAGSDTAGKIGYVNCAGAFNTASNTYTGQCVPDEMTADQIAAWKAQGNSIILNLQRV